MAGVISEHVISRTETAGKRDPVAELVFDITDAVDENDVHNTVAAAMANNTIPPFYSGLPFTNYNMQTVGNGLWIVRVNYTQRGLPALTFDTTGSKEKITVAKEHIKSYVPPVPGGGPPLPAPDFKASIGVTDDGVDGVEITLPRFGFTLTRYLSPSVLTAPDFVRTIRKLTGRTNQDTFYGFDIGEVLFLGASGSQRGLEDVEVNYRFEASLNRTDIMVGEIGPIDKKGWEYLWIRFESYVDPVAKKLVKRPASVHVERVYDPDDFGLLNLQ